MKKTFVLLLALLLSLSLLWGCGTTSNTETTAPSTPPTPTDLYCNLDKGATLTPDASGNYRVNFLLEKVKKTYTITDKALLDQLLLLDFVGLQLDGDTITGFVRMEEMPYRYAFRNHYVKEISSSTATLNLLSNFKGPETKYAFPAKLPLYNLVPGSDTFGTITDLKANDRVSVILDGNGSPYFAYVSERANDSVPHEGLLYCAHCKQEVAWMDWLSTTTLPSTPGHYLLSDNITLTTNTNLADVQICLDLNGKTVRQSKFGQRIYTMTSAGTLSILDSVGTGTMIANSTDENGQRYGMVVRVESDQSVLNLYSGTLDARNCTAQTGTAISFVGTFNMYGGTIYGGSAYGTGSSAVSASGVFNMYDGKIVGGQHVSTSYTPLNPPGGGAIRILGTATIYGGIIEGGESYSVGGVIRLSPDAKESSGTSHLIIKGGTITGGKGSQGSGIYVCAGAKVTISGDAKITGNQGDNLYLETGATLAIGEEGLSEGAQIGPSTAGSGTFVTNVPENMDLTQFFTSDDTTKSLVNAGNGSWSLE